MVSLAFSCQSHPNLGLEVMPLREHETFALGLRNRIAELSCRVDPELYSFVDVLDRRFLTVAMRHTSGQFGYFCNESPISLLQ